MGRLNHPVTPDGRYFVVRGRLWRCSNPALDPERRAELVRELMLARRTRNRLEVDAAKRALGERGEPWWTDGAPDWNRHLARNTPYAEWFAGLDATGHDPEARTLHAGDQQVGD